MDDIEDYRRTAVADLHRGATFAKAWKTWKPAVMAATGNLGDAKGIYELGSQLAGIFALTAPKTKKRNQKVVAAAGSGWEALVCWYLNAVFTGTRGIAVQKKKDLVPGCIADALTVNYGSSPTNTETDLLVIVFPEGFDFPPGASMHELSDAISVRFTEFEVGVVQCKTNWNENAQIPMLWDMVYRAKGFKDHSVSIGRAGHAIKFLKEFSHSFVTMPTQKSPFHPELMPVRRVRNLTGGNYWGKPCEAGVALAVSEIFNRNFMSAFDKPIVPSIHDAVTSGKGKLPIK